MRSASRKVSKYFWTSAGEASSYGARGSFSHQRLSLADPADPTGELTYTLKTPWRDGTEAITLSSSELLEKLVALIPPPYLHASRYIGILSSHSKWRHQIVLAPDVKKGFALAEDGASVVRMSWSRLLKRTFKFDLERCLVCGARVYPENFVLVDEPFVITVTMRMLGMRASGPARAPPRGPALGLDEDQSRL